MTTTDRIEAGKVLRSTYGYEQTNVEFFFVLKRSATMATIVKIAADRRDDGGFMTYTATPRVPMTPVGSPIRRKVKTYRDEEFVMVTDYQLARPHNGEPVAGSSYA